MSDQHTPETQTDAQQDGAKHYDDRPEDGYQPTTHASRTLASPGRGPTRNNKPRLTPRSFPDECVRTPSNPQANGQQGGTNGNGRHHVSGR